MDLEMKFWHVYKQINTGYVFSIISRVTNQNKWKKTLGFYNFQPRTSRSPSPETAVLEAPRVHYVRDSSALEGGRVTGGHAAPSGGYLILGTWECQVEN